MSPRSKIFLISGLVCRIIATDAATIVIPPELAAANGNLSGGFQSNGERVQQAYGSSLFAAVAGQSLAISEVRLRVDPNAPPFSATSQIEMRLSTTTQNPDALSLSWAANTGADEVVALPRSTIAWGGNPGLSFDAVIPLPNHFVYSPANGSLLLDITLYATGSQVGTFDVVSINGDGISSVGGFTGRLLADGSGTAGFVTAFTYSVVPEPTSIVLLACGLLVTRRAK